MAPEYTNGGSRILREGEAIEVEPKNPFASTTLYGVIIAAGTRALSRYVPEDLIAGDVREALVVELVGYAIGLALVVYGRWKATRPLGFGTFKSAVVKLVPTVFVLTAVCVSGCGSIPGPHQIPEDWVRTDRDTYNAVAPEYQQYVNEDATKTLGDKQDTRNTIDVWDRRLDARERSLKLPNVEEPVPPVPPGPPAPTPPDADGPAEDPANN
jgi:hypothetical protein